MKILIGTTNKNKFKQFLKAFEIHGKGHKLVSLSDLGLKDDVEEDGKTLLENARKKARHFGEKSGLMTLSDDLGLFVDALGGKPGVHSKRWHPGSEIDRNKKLLEELEGVSEENRTAKYTGALSFYDPVFKFSWEYEKAVDGRICENYTGDDGFGYDPIFLENSSQKRFSELSEDENLAISHRGLGVKELLNFLKIYVD